MVRGGWGRGVLFVYFAAYLTDCRFSQLIVGLRNGSWVCAMNYGFRNESSVFTMNSGFSQWIVGLRNGLWVCVINYWL